MKLQIFPVVALLVTTAAPLLARPSQDNNNAGCAKPCLELQSVRGPVATDNMRSEYSLKMYDTQKEALVGRSVKRAHPDEPCTMVDKLQSQDPLLKLWIDSAGYHDAFGKEIPNWLYDWNHYMLQLRQTLKCPDDGLLAHTPSHTSSSSSSPASSIMEADISALLVRQDIDAKTCLKIFDSRLNIDDIIDDWKKHQPADVPGWLLCWDNFMEDLARRAGCEPPNEDTPPRLAKRFSRADKKQDCNGVS